MQKHKIRGGRKNTIIIAILIKKDLTSVLILVGLKIIIQEPVKIIPEFRGS